MTEAIFNKTHVCPHQMAFTLDNWIRRLFQHPTPIVGPFLQPGDTAVDLGCGPGFFTMDMARLVGETGRVFAVDLQEKMLARLMQKARRHGLDGRVATHQCTAERIGLAAQADFVLACYVLHETPEPAAFLAEVRGFLKPGGRFLVMEPPFHVSRRRFAGFVKTAEKAGYTVTDRPGGRRGLRMLLTH